MQSTGLQKMCPSTIGLGSLSHRNTVSLVPRLTCETEKVQLIHRWPFVSVTWQHGDICCLWCWFQTISFSKLRSCQKHWLKTGIRESTSSRASRQSFLLDTPHVLWPAVQFAKSTQDWNSNSVGLYELRSSIIIGCKCKSLNHSKW